MIRGKSDVGRIVCTPGPAMANVIGSGSTMPSPSRSILGLVLAQLMASRRLPGPLLAVLVTTSVQIPAENSDVSTGDKPVAGCPLCRQ